MVHAQRIGQGSDRRLVDRARFEACHIVGAQVANSVMEKREHPVGLQRQDVNADMQFALEGEEWKKPAGLNLFAGVSIHDKRCIVPPSKLETIGSVRKAVLHGRTLCSALPAVAVKLAKQTRKPRIVEDLSLDSDAAQLLKQRPGAVLERGAKIRRDESGLVT